MLNRNDLSRADLNLLVLFEVVFEERNVGRAAEKLHLSPSAVSHGLGRLRRLLNDPLFLRTPRGVVPSARAVEIIGPITEVLAGARAVIAAAEPFDPASSRRRFVIGAPDGVSAVFLPALLAELRRTALGIDVGVRQVLPAAGEFAPDRAWRSAFSDLEARALDVAIVPTDAVPARFHARLLYEEDFVVVVRAGHPFAAHPTLDAFCAAQHLVVSNTGDPHGFVDERLAAQGRARRIALTVPSFLLGLAIVAGSDLMAAMPRRFAAVHASRFAIAGLEAPFQLASFRLNAVTPAAAMMDAGVAWLCGLLERATQDAGH